MSNNSPSKQSGPEAGVKGAIEDVKGKAKEAVGVLTGNDKLEQEGEAQQQKAGKQKEAAKHEAQADVARAEAEAAEAQQKANQN